MLPDFLSSFNSLGQKKTPLDKPGFSLFKERDRRGRGQASVHQGQSSAPCLDSFGRQDITFKPVDSPAGKFFNHDFPRPTSRMGKGNSSDAVPFIEQDCGIRGAEEFFRLGDGLDKTRVVIVRVDLSLICPRDKRPAILGWFPADLKTVLHLFTLIVRRESASLKCLSARRRERAADISPRQTDILLRQWLRARPCPV